VCVLNRHTVKTYRRMKVMDASWIFRWGGGVVVTASFQSDFSHKILLHLINLKLFLLITLECVE
jgi:hypothetical protein